MSKKKNVFISHYNKDDKHLHSLIDRLNKKDMRFAMVLSIGLSIDHIV